MPSTDAHALTSFSRGAGCGCKLSSAELHEAIGTMRTAFPVAPEVLVSSSTADDAGVVRISAELALVQTLDFFTPIVDDARTWGQIAATNALSDVYAMGGRPVTAMNIVGWPRDTLPWELLGQVLDGAAEVVAAADCSLVGGHSIDDAEPKFGLSVTGLVHPDRILTNAGGRPGDALVLTKPLGVGILTTAVKRGLGPRTDEERAVACMLRTNRRASEVAVEHGLRCATDVTGFGLMGHLREMIVASGVDAEVEIDAVPVIPGVRALIEAGAVPGGTQRNLDDTAHVDWSAVPTTDQVVLCDAQTSGGLLLAVPPSDVEGTLAGLNGTGEGDASVIGHLVDRPGGVEGDPRVTFG